MYKINYYFFRPNNKITKSYDDVETAEYWFNRFSNDDNYTCVSKSW
jgi:hypothetical protein